MLPPIVLDLVASIEYALPLRPRLQYHRVCLRSTRTPPALSPPFRFSIAPPDTRSTGWLSSAAALNCWLRRRPVPRHTASPLASSAAAGTRDRLCATRGTRDRLRVGPRR